MKRTCNRPFSSRSPLNLTKTISSSNSRTRSRGSDPEALILSSVSAIVGDASATSLAIFTGTVGGRGGRGGVKRYARAYLRKTRYRGTLGYRNQSRDRHISRDTYNFVRLIRTRVTDVTPMAQLSRSLTYRETNASTELPM